MTTRTDSTVVPGSELSGERLGPPPVARRLAWALAVATLAAAVPTLFWPELIHGPAAMVGSAQGTALVMLVVALPLLVGSQIALARGAARILPLWLAAVLFLVYNGFMLLFAVPFNSLFPAYVATWSLGIWTLIVAAPAIDVSAVRRRYRDRMPRRTISIYLWVVTAFNIAAWLRGLVPGLFDSESPAFLEGTGLTTLPTYVQDFAFWLPLMAVAGIGLWRGRAWGHLLTAAVLVQSAIEALSIASDQFFGALADPASPVVTMAATPPFLVLAAVTAAFAAPLFRRNREPVPPAPIASR